MPHYWASPRYKCCLFKCDLSFHHLVGSKLLLDLEIAQFGAVLVHGNGSGDGGHVIVLQHLAHDEVHAWGDVDGQGTLDAVGDLLADVDGIIHKAAHVFHVVGCLGEFLAIGIERDVLAVNAVGQRFAQGLLHFIGVNGVHDASVAVVVKA